MLSRKLASQNHYPAIDILGSVSRLMPSIVDGEHLRLAGHIRDLLSAYRESEDLINIGAYVKGSNARIDEAIAHQESLNQFLRQDLSQSISWQNSREAMEGLFAPPS